MSEEEKSLNKDLEEESEKSVKNDESEKSSVESEESEESESGESPLSDAKDESDDEDEPVDNLGVKRNVDDDISEKDINDYFDDTVEEKVPKKSKHREVKKTKAELEQEEDEKKRREMDQIIENFLSTLRELNDKDKLCLEQKKPAINRISYLTTLRTRLSNAEFTEACLSHGLLMVLNDWLVLEKGLPSYELRTNLIEMISNLMPTYNQVSESGIGKTLLAYYNHPKETDENKQILKGLIYKWLRTLVADEDTWTQRERIKAKRESYRNAMLYASRPNYDELDGHEQAVHAIQAPASMNIFYKNVSGDIDTK